jgi:glycosyltransferase involved in cell wall biosynthesis
MLFPTVGGWHTQLQQTLALRLFDLTEVNGQPVERLITIREPAHCMAHARKVAWFIHHYRPAYDLFGTPWQYFPDTPEGLAFREQIMRYDDQCLRECHRLYTNSKIVAQRLRTFNRLEADDVLYPPLPGSEAYHDDEPGDYFLYTSRLNDIKRQALAIHALALTRSNIRLVLAGKGDTPELEAGMKRLAHELGVDTRVVFTGYIDEAEKVRLNAQAFAALYIPFDEDSYGYPTLEAFHSHRPVITCTDSGGTHEIIEHGVNGLIVEPTPEALAEAMEYLWSDAARTRAMGRAAHASLRQYGIAWNRVIEKLLA